MYPRPYPANSELKITRPVFLHERNDSNLKPYTRKACDVFAEGIATELQMQYLPMKEKELQVHALLISNSTVKWVKINHENLVDHDFICIGNYQTDNLNKKEG